MDDDNLFPEEPPFRPNIEERLKKVINTLLKETGAKATTCKKYKGSNTAVCQIETADGKKGTVDIELNQKNSIIKIKLPKSPKIDIEEFAESEFL